MSLRQRQLESIRDVRDGRVTPNKLDFAEHVMRIPEQDYYALLQIFPDLNSTDAKTQKAEWERFFKSDFALAYRVARTPIQVQRSPRRFT